MGRIGRRRLIWIFIKMGSFGFVWVRLGSFFGLFRVKLGSLVPECFFFGRIITAKDSKV